MLKHVSYRSSSASLSRPCEYSFRSSSRNAPSDGHRSDFNSSYSPVRIKDDLGPLETYHNSYPYRRNPDNVSLTSALSFSSLAMTGTKYCSRTSSTISLNDQSTVPVKIYLHRLRTDMEYKTVSLSLQTTCKELIVLLLTKFRLRHRDPNLFFVLMEVTVRAPSDGAPVKRQLVLEDNARPAELQQCRPKGEANFSIGVRRGGLLRIHDSILNPVSQYKSLMVSYTTTADQLVQLLLNCHNNREDPKHYCIHEVCKSTSIDRLLKPDENPIQVQAKWPRENRNFWMFVLRRNISYTLSMKSKFSWRRSLDQSSTDTESELEDHDTTRASIMSSSSTASNSSSISNSSSGVSSDASSDASSTCSSSGVSSSGGGSLISSPEASPTTKPPLPAPPSTFNESGTSLKPSSKPPKPVPRTLFPSKKSTTTNNDDEEDSGIVLDDDVTLLQLDEEEDLKPELPPRASTISSGSFPFSSSPKYVSTKSLSKSSVNLSFVSPISGSKSKSFLNLSLTFLNNDKAPSAPSTPTKPPTVTNRIENRFSRTGSPVVSPFKLKLSTSTGVKDSSCACKNCFYI